MKQKSFKELFKEAKERGTYWAASIILDFTEGLHKIMEANRVTRSDLARRLGVTPAYVTKVLRGNVNFTVDSMVRLGRAAGGGIRRYPRTDETSRIKAPSDRVSCRGDER